MAAVGVAEIGFPAIVNGRALKSPEDPDVRHRLGSAFSMKSEVREERIGSAMQPAILFLVAKSGLIEMYRPQRLGQPIGNTVFGVGQGVKGFFVPGSERAARQAMTEEIVDQFAGIARRAGVVRGLDR